jgi:hypothetical protein
VNNNIPTWWEALLLTAAAFRIWRLLAADVILDRPRDWLVGRDEWEARKNYRPALDQWLHCPWCFGFWISLVVYGTWVLWPTAMLLVAVPLTLNTGMAFMAKHWDR